MTNPNDREIKNVCMLSTHGYFDPIPQLGITDTGGQVVYVLQLAKALSTKRIKVDIFTRWFDRSRPQIDPVPDFPDVRVVRIPAGPWKFIPKEEIYAVLPELAENMIEFIQENSLRYDLYHGHYVDAGIVTIDVAARLEKPAFFTAHSLGAWKREQMEGDAEDLERKFKFEHRVSEELRIFGTVNAQSVTSDVQMTKLEQLYEFTADNIVIIPPGVDIHRFSPPEPGAGTTDLKLPNRYIFCLSRIDSNKGHDLLLNAFDRVRKDHPDVQLVIGGGSPEPEHRELEVLESIRRIIDEKDLDESVRILGYVPDDMLVSLYQHAELFVLPSIFEPFGMTAQEAMACGSPVVASKLGGIKSVISSGENGLLIDPSDAEEFADAISMLLKDRNLAQSMGEKGNDTIREYFSWEAIADKHIAFYRKFM
jgi:mannosylfructose-phosphate synthase